MEYAVRKQIKHLCGYISDKTAVLQHINREHNLRLTLRDIEYRRSHNAPPRTADRPSRYDTIAADCDAQAQGARPAG